MCRESLLGVWLGRRRPPLDDLEDDTKERERHQRQKAAIERDLAGKTAALAGALLFITLLTVGVAVMLDEAPAVESHARL